MIGRLFIVLVLGGVLMVAASWNTRSDHSATTASRRTSQPEAIMTVAIEPDRAPPFPAPAPPVVRSSRERLIAQN
jgi:hypothetical protein